LSSRPSSALQAAMVPSPQKSGCTEETLFLWGHPDRL